MHFFPSSLQLNALKFPFNTRVTKSFRNFKIPSAQWSKLFSMRVRWWNAYYIFATSWSQSHSEIIYAFQIPHKNECYPLRWCYLHFSLTTALLFLGKFHVISHLKNFCGKPFFFIFIPFHLWTSLAREINRVVQNNSTVAAQKQPYNQNLCSYCSTILSFPLQLMVIMCESEIKLEI